MAERAKSKHGFPASPSHFLWHLVNVGFLYESMEGGIEFPEWLVLDCRSSTLMYGNSDTDYIQF